jgi:hypothetical protein
VARYALLVGASRSILGQAEIPRALIDSNIQAITEALTRLGSYSFTWPKSTVPERIGGNRTAVSHKLDSFRTQKVIPTEDDIFLLYYFGHGIIKNNQLCLSFEQLNLSGDTSPYTLSSVLVDVKNIGFRKIIIILDCCHSGNAEGSVNIALSDVAHCLLTAASSSWAHFSASGGLFTQALARALSYKNVVRNPRYGGITFESWFQFVKEELEAANQSPRATGSLLKEILVPAELEIVKSLNERAPRKSLYYKIYSVLDVLARTYKTLDIIYSEIGQMRPPEFLISGVTDGRVSVRLITINKIREYLSLASALGFAENDGSQKWRITALGREARAGAGSEFNAHLVERVEMQLEQSGLCSKLIKENLFILAEQGRVPNIANMERLLIEQKTRVPERKLFKYWMSLLGYSGVIQRATTDTYFPR